jgi:signal transduction histidine kinase
MLAAAEPFLRAGLERGERCMYLAADVAAASRLRALGAVSVVSGADSYLQALQNGVFDPSHMLDWLRAQADEAARAGSSALRIVGELACLLGVGMDRIPEYEARVNNLVHERSISVMCGYDQTRLPHSHLREALATHPLALVRGNVCHNPHFIRPGDFLSPQRLVRETVWLLENLHDAQLTENERAGADAHSKDLLRRFFGAQETERKTLARDLHDDLAQILASIQMTLQPIGDPAGPAVVEARALLGEAIESVRSLALNLRPSILDDLGLAAALRSYLERQVRRTGLDIRIDLGQLEDVLPEGALNCLRIVQEAVANAIRHAGARRIDVLVHSHCGHLELVVRDDGRGFDVTAPRAASQFGLSAMAERAALAGGGFAVESTLGAGTTVRARFPTSAP